MPTTRKQKKARKSRGLEIFSDIENLDIMLDENHFNETERDESLDSASVRRHDSVMSNNLENEGGSSYSNHMNSNVVNGQNSAEVSSQAEINKLSSELNSRISREMDEMMNSVSIQIQRAMNDAISNQVLPQIQNVIWA